MSDGISLITERDAAIATRDRRIDAPSITVVANSPALRAGLLTMLRQDDTLAVLSDDELAAGAVPDVVLLDAGAVRLLDELLAEQWPRANVLIVGEPPDDALNGGSDRVIGAVSSGIASSALIAAARAVAAGLVVIDPALDAHFHLQRAAESGDYPVVEDILTPRERQVLLLVAAGYPNKSIAYELGISEHTAKFHVGSLLSKLDAASRAEVVTNATRRGLLTV